jgi:hypothetical protein
MRTRFVVGIAATIAWVGGSALAQAPGADRPLARRGNFPLMMGGVAVGAVSQIDRARNAIQVQTTGPAGNETRWVLVTPDTEIYLQRTGTLAELKPGDTIVVSGVPTSVNASQIQIGVVPPTFAGMRGATFLPGPPPGTPTPPIPPGAQGAPPAPPGGPVPSDLPPPGPPGFAPPGGFPGPGGGMATRLMGTVVSPNPLVVMLPGNVRLNVVADATTRIARVGRATLADLKVGDTLRAFGRPDEMGNVLATRVEAGMDMAPGFGPGGFVPGFGGAAVPVPLPQGGGQF